MWSRSAYEWNTRHDTGRYRQIVEESVMLTGDENLVEVYGVIHYQIADPAAFVFRARDPDQLVRLSAESALRWTVAQRHLDAVLTSERYRDRRGLERSSGDDSGGLRSRRGDPLSPSHRGASSVGSSRSVS